MNTLDDLQRGFQRYLLAALPADGAVPPLAAAVRSTPGLSAAARLAIYHRAYRARLREALCAAYDKTWSYLGDELFAALADAYLSAHPSDQPNLRWFGGALAAQAAQLFPEEPRIAELAAFEWALGLAFDAADTPALTRADLAAVAPDDWGGLAFSLHPSAHVLRMEWNAAALWQAMAAGVDAPPPERHTPPAHWLLWRHAGQSHFRSLSALEAQALHRVAQGWTFGAICGEAYALAADSGADADNAMVALAAALQQWTAQELLVRPR